MTYFWKTLLGAVADGGAVLLGWSLRFKPSDTTFYLLSLVPVLLTKTFI